MSSEEHTSVKPNMNLNPQIQMMSLQQLAFTKQNTFETIWKGSGYI